MSAANYESILAALQAAEVRYVIAGGTPVSLNRHEAGLSPPYGPDS